MPTVKPGEFKQFLADNFGEYFFDPLGFTMFMYPWDKDISIQMVPWNPKVAKTPELKRHALQFEEYRDFYNVDHGPDIWACQYLQEWGEIIQGRNFDGQNAVDPIQMSTASGHGIGKSALVAWIVMFIMCTRPYCKGTITATTEPQLRNRTWAEVGKWYKRSLVNGLFNFNSARGSMKIAYPEDKEEWFTQAVTCKEENSESFAGQHAVNSTSYYIFDEASGVPNSIWKVREGGLSDGEPMTHDFGNPTKNTGIFFENMEGRFARRYVTRSIDSRTVAITNKRYFNRMVEDHGEDSDHVKVRVRGMFPSIGMKQFMPTDKVKHAMNRPIPLFDRVNPLVIGVDCARYGDDESVIFPRLGHDARTYKPKRLRKMDSTFITNEVIETVGFFRAKSIEYGEIFVDSTGGYGAGVADQLRRSGYHCVEVNFGNTAPDDRYRFVADMIWGRLRDDIEKGLVLPDMGDNFGSLLSMYSDEDFEADSSIIPDELGRDLFQQLTGRQFSYTLAGNKIHLEPKEDMKDRICSPDLVDALALTYTTKVAPRTTPFGEQNPHTFAIQDFDPYEDNLETGSERW